MVDCSIRYVGLENVEDSVKQCLCFVITVHVSVMSCLLGKFLLNLLCSIRNVP